MKSMDSLQTKSLLEKDRKYVWHPFTQMKDYAEKDHLLIERAEGICLYDSEGNSYYDTVSSWWVNIHGHGHPRIKAAVSRQLECLDHVIFSGVTHEAGILLAEALVEITPEPLTRVFYSDNGSTAVEVALKMSFQYWNHMGQSQKTRFAYLQHSYHGDTLGAVSVGGVDLFHSTFRPLLFPAQLVPSPADGEEESLASIKSLFEQKSGEISAIIVEPILQAAGGMKIHSAAWLRTLRALCNAYSVHLIFDEVATGFGRTGRMFACEHADVSPDLICLSKGLTAGVVPLSATLATEEIYMAFYDDYATFKTFFHGHSFTGNPVACAVALESLAIFRDERRLERAEPVMERIQLHLQSLSSIPCVANQRGIGFVAAWDLVDPNTKKPFPVERRAGRDVYETGLANGLILRPLGNTLYWWLPLVTSVEEIDIIAERTKQILATSFPS
jgi:adenosylmethionine---8-amino-7-oxononanoate aminotransferase